MMIPTIHFCQVTGIQSYLGAELSLSSCPTQDEARHTVYHCSIVPLWHFNHVAHPTASEALTCQLLVDHLILLLCCYRPLHQDALFQCSLISVCGLLILLDLFLPVVNDVSLLP